MNGKFWAERIDFVLGTASFLRLDIYGSYIAAKDANQTGSARREISPISASNLENQIHTRLKSARVHCVPPANKQESPLRTQVVGN